MKATEIELYLGKTKVSTYSCRHVHESLIIQTDFWICHKIGKWNKQTEFNNNLELVET